MLRSTIKNGLESVKTSDMPIPAAGVSTKLTESAQDCMSWRLREPTPPRIRRFRQSILYEPGQIVRHVGLALDSIPKGPFGAKTISSVDESAKDYMRTYPETHIGQWLRNRKEAIYARYSCLRNNLILLGILDCGSLQYT